MRQAKLTSKGQVTVPKSIRDYLKLRTGDQLQFIIDQKGYVILMAQNLDISEIFGKFQHKAKKKTTVKDMNKVIGKAITRKYLYASRRH